MTGEITLHTRGVDPAPSLLLQVVVPADVVGVGVGIVDSAQVPAVGFQDLAHLAPCVLVAAAVNEADIVPLQAHQTDLGRALDVITLFGNLDQLIHIAFAS